MVTDASDTHIGGALQQLEGGAWRPLGFFSRKLSQTEVKYSTFDRELLACFAVIRHFRFMLEGRHFQLWTDHKPLLAALQRVSDPWTPRQQRQLAFIAECTSDVLHVPDIENVVADTLSRPPVVNICSAAHSVPLDEANGDGVLQGPQVVDYKEMAAQQKTWRTWTPSVTPPA